MNVLKFICFIFTQYPNQTTNLFGVHLWFALLLLSVDTSGVGFQYYLSLLTLLTYGFFLAYTGYVLRPWCDAFKEHQKNEINQAVRPA